MQLVPETGITRLVWITGRRRRSGHRPSKSARPTHAELLRPASSSIAVEAFDRPPRITSIPVREGRSGELVPLRRRGLRRRRRRAHVRLAAPAPPGMTIDPATGRDRVDADAGSTLSDRDTSSVRVSDPAAAPSKIRSAPASPSPPIRSCSSPPNGTFTVRVGRDPRAGRSSRTTRGRAISRSRCPPNATFEGNALPFHARPSAGRLGSANSASYAASSRR